MRSYNGAVFVFILACAVASSSFSFAQEGDLQKADELFAKRADTFTYGQAMALYEQYYSKNKPDLEKSVFLARAYYYFGQRYHNANAKKAIQQYNLGAKWAQVGQGIDKDDYRVKFWWIVNRLRAGQLKTRNEAVEINKKSKDELEALASSKQDEYLAYWALGILYRETQEWPIGYRDYAKSGEMADKAFKLAPQNPECAVDLLRTLIELKKYSDALILAAKIPQLTGEAGWEVEADLAKKAAEEELSKIKGQK